MDKLDALRVLVAVCESGGFAPAARRLGMSPSAATRHVDALETSLGVGLLARTTRSVGVTDAGRRYLESAREILRVVADADEAARSDGAGARGRMVVAAPPAFGRTHVAGVLCRYMMANPDVVAELRLDGRRQGLVDDGVDVAIRVGAMGDSTLVSRRVGETRHVVVGSPAYLDAFGRPSDPGDLARHHVTLFTGLAPAGEWRFERDGVGRRVRVSPRFTTNSGDAAIGHVIDGGGVTRALAYQVADAVRERRLEVVLDAFEPAPLPISVVYRSRRLMPARVRAFIDLLAAGTDWRFVDLRRDRVDAGGGGSCAPPRAAPTGTPAAGLTATA